MQEFSLGSCPPTLGENGMRWMTSGEQVVVHILCCVLSERLTKSIVYLFKTQLNTSIIYLFLNMQQVMSLGFDWHSKEMSVMFMAKLSTPLMGTARIVINSIHIKGNVCLMLSPLCSF